MAVGEAKLGGGGVFEDRTGDVLQHAAVEESGEGRVEKDGEGAGGLLEEETVGKLFGGSTAEGQDGVRAAKGRGERGGFEAAEVGFAVAGEELGYSGAGASFEVGIEVEEVPLEAGGDEAADGGLARSHEAGEGETTEVCRDDRGGGRYFRGCLHHLERVQCGWGGHRCFSLIVYYWSRLRCFVLG